MSVEEDVIDDFHQQVYNTYLKIRAKYEDRPYRNRKNFKDFKYNKDILKICRVFRSYPHINIEKFFEAPYKIWETNEIYNIDFYSKRKALNCYVNYKKMLLTISPDDDYHLKELINGFYFIKGFCLKNGLNIEDYIDHKNGIYSFLTHLKEDKVSIYNLFCFDNFKYKFKTEVDSELKKTLFSDLYIDYDIMYRRFMTSKKCRALGKKCLQKVKQSVNIKI